MTGDWAQAKVLDASDRSYTERVLPFLEKARKEIAISLYLVDADDAAGPFHPVNRFLETLIRARRRGVRVRLVLNTKFRVRLKTEVALGKYFNRLLEAGVEIGTILPNRRLHDKLIVIDGRYVVEGSTNWSVSALASNYESDSIIDSRAHAEKKLRRIERLTLPPLPKEKEIDRPLLSLPETVEVPAGLFEKGGLSKMIGGSDERAFDLYLLLLGQCRAAGKSELEIDLESVGRGLGLPSGWNRSQIRRQVIKVLRKLEKHYRLLEAEFPYGQNARIRLREETGKQISVPGWLLSAEYLAKARAGEAFLALAREALSQEGIQIDSLSAPELERRFGIGRSAVVRARRVQR